MLMKQISIFRRKKDELDNCMQYFQNFQNVDQNNQRSLDNMPKVKKF